MYMANVPCRFHMSTSAFGTPGTPESSSPLGRSARCGGMGEMLLGSPLRQGGESHGCLSVFFLEARVTWGLGFPASASVEHTGGVPGPVTMRRCERCGGESLSRVRLCDPTDCSPPGSSVHGILQARTLEWVAISSSRGPSGTKDRTCVFYIAGGFFTNWTTVRIFSMALFSREGANVSWMWCEIFITQFEPISQTDVEVGTSAKIVLLRGHAGQRPTSWFLESFYLDMYVSSLH